MKERQNSKNRSSFGNLNIIALTVLLAVIGCFFVFYNPFAGAFAPSEESSKAAASSKSGKSVTPTPGQLYILEETSILANYQITPAASVGEIITVRLPVKSGVFPSKKGLTAAELRNEIKAVVESVKALGAGALLVDAAPGFEAVYPTELLPASGLIPEGVDLLGLIIEEARTAGLRVSVCLSPFTPVEKQVFRLNPSSSSASSSASAASAPDKSGLSPVSSAPGQSSSGNGLSRLNDPSEYVKLSDGTFMLNPSNPNIRKRITEVAGELAERYELYSILLDSPAYPSGEFDDGLMYLLYGGMLTKDEYRVFSLDALVAGFSAAVKTANPSAFVGVITDAVWATALERDGGLDVQSADSSLTRHFADTYKWIQSGFIDIICPKLSYSTTHSTLPFEKLMDWWSTVAAETGVGLMPVHAAYKLGTSEKGWSSSGQLVMQLKKASDYAQYAGSILDDYAALRHSPQEWELIKKYNAGTINLSTIFNTLSVNAPKNNTVTNQPSIAIRGTCDVNFPITLNGKEIKPSSKGYFAETVSLKPGVNTFTISHKGVTKTIKVTYKVDLFKGISPSSGSVETAGGSTVSVSVIAYEGATVTGTLNGVTVKFTPVESAGGDEEDSKKYEGYMRYVGVFTMPKATTKRQELGAVKVTAKWSGFTESITGAKYYVKEKAPSPAIAEVTVERAEAFLATDKDDISTPEVYYLPKGTRDIIVGEGSYGGVPYWILKSGFTVYKKDCRTYDDDELKVNKVSSVTVRQTAQFTEFVFANSERVPYFAEFDVTFKNPSDYNFNTDFSKATKFTLTLHNTSSAPEISGNLGDTFSSCKLTKGSGTYSYTFTLKDAGKFYGFDTLYDKDGNFILRVRRRLDLASSDPQKPLAGLKILLSPGHGGSDPGATNPNHKHPNENELNVMVTLALKDRLEKLGAEVVATRKTAGEYVSRVERQAIFAETQYDLILAIHHNSATSPSANGSVCIYFYPQSQTFAKEIAASISEALPSKKNRGGTYGNYWETRYYHCPTIIIECGFVSNDDEFLWLSQNTDVTAERIAVGILNSLGKEMPEPEPDTSSGSASSDSTSSEPLVVTETAAPARREDML